MTAIAYKDGIIATDTATFQHELIVGFRCKIVVLNHLCWAACGMVPEIAAFAEWAEGGFKGDARPPKSDNFGAVIVYRDGRVFKCGETFVLYDVSQYDAPVVDGASCEFMLGVLYAGGSAADAVNMAIKHSAWAGGECVAFDTRAWGWML